MKSPLIKTLVMAIMAAATSIVASVFYPWPEPVIVSAIVGTPLFESYDSSAVRSIRIVRFSTERNGLEQIQLRRSGEKWIVPAKKNFIATNSRQIAAAANCLIDRTVLEDTTDEQQAYLEYSVVDPDEYETTPNPSALGTKVILEDRNRRELASLIIGTGLKDDPTGLKHFVRIPGQPNVYVIEFDTGALSTDFKSWVDPNLLQLSNQMPINKIEIDNYRIDLQSKARQLIYRAGMEVRDQQLHLVSVDVGGSDGKWSGVNVTNTMSQQVQVLGTQIGAIRFSDVQRKDSELAKLLKAPRDEGDDSIFDSLKSFGFLKTGFKNSAFAFDSVGGNVSVATADGVVVTLNIGSIAAKSNGDNLLLSHYTMVSAGVDESILPEPEKPAAANEDDAVEKAYLRLVKERESKIKSAKVRASDLNQRHADWIYVVSEDVIEKIRPDIDVSAATPLPKSSAEILKAAISDAKKSESAKPDPDNDKSDKD